MFKKIGTAISGIWKKPGFSSNKEVPKRTSEKKGDVEQKPIGERHVSLPKSPLDGFLKNFKPEDIEGFTSDIGFHEAPAEEQLNFLSQNAYKFDKFTPEQNKALSELVDNINVGEDKELGEQLKYIKNQIPKPKSSSQDVPEIVLKEKKLPKGVPKTGFKLFPDPPKKPVATNQPPLSSPSSSSSSSSIVMEEKSPPPPPPGSDVPTPPPPPGVFGNAPPPPPGSGFGMPPSMPTVKKYSMNRYFDQQKFPTRLNDALKEAIPNSKDRMWFINNIIKSAIDEIAKLPNQEKDNMADLVMAEISKQMKEVIGAYINGIKTNLDFKPMATMNSALVPVEAKNMTFFKEKAFVNHMRNLKKIIGLEIGKTMETVGVKMTRTIKKKVVDKKPVLSKADPEHTKIIQNNAPLLHGAKQALSENLEKLVGGFESLKGYISNFGILDKHDIQNKIKTAEKFETVVEFIESEIIAKDPEIMKFKQQMAEFKGDPMKRTQAQMMLSQRELLLRNQINKVLSKPINLQKQAVLKERSNQLGEIDFDLDTF